jgi:hypothetical protein
MMLVFLSGLFEPLFLPSEKLGIFDDKLPFLTLPGLVPKTPRSCRLSTNAFGNKPHCPFAFCPVQHHWSWYLNPIWVIVSPLLNLSQGSSFDFFSLKSHFAKATRLLLEFMTSSSLPGWSIAIVEVGNDPRRPSW